MHATNDRIDWRLLAAFFIVTATGLVLRSIHGGMPLLNDTDDAMRLVQVHDLLAGQGWYDLTQHRLNTPYGASMHWSRLIDAPIAGLILLLRPLLGASAEAGAAYVWPLLMLLAVFWLSAKLAVRLVGPEGLLPGLALPAFSLVSLADFSPGRIDHHSVQVLLLLVMALSAVDAVQRPRRAAWAGIAAAVAIAIGIESLPGVVSAILAFGLLWVIDGRHAMALRWFGLSFALASLGCLALSLPPSLWLVPACDGISSVYAVTAVGAGLAFFSLSTLPRLGSWQARLVAGFAGGAALVAIVAVLFPECLRGPYAALDPWLVHNWLDRIEEAQPLFVAVFNNPVFVIAATVPALLAVVVAGWKIVASGAADRPKWIAYSAFLIVAVLVALVQVRAGRMATSLAVPAGAALIVAARARYLSRPRIGPILGLVGSWIGFAGLALAFLVGIATTAASPARPAGSPAAAALAGANCRQPATFTALAALPPARIMNPIDLGSHILLFSAHDVVAAPYHRNQSGVRDAFRFFNEPIAEARQILAERGVTLVVICPGMPELRGAGAVPDSFLKLLDAGQLPAWLTETTPPGSGLRTFSVAS